MAGVSRQIDRHQDARPIEDCRQQAAAGLERLAAEIASVLVQQIERIEGDGVIRVCRSVLQRLEGRPAVRVDRDDFAVDRRLPGVELSRRRRDARIGRREVLVVARANLDAVAVLDDERPVPVELDLVEPLVAVGQLVDDARGHRA